MSYCRVRSTVVLVLYSHFPAFSFIGLRFPTVAMEVLIFQFHFSYLAFHFSFFNGATRHNIFRPQWKLLITHAAQFTLCMSLPLSALPFSHMMCITCRLLLYALMVYPFPAPRSITIPIVSRFPFRKEICGKTDEKNSISVAHSSKFLRTYPKFYFFFSGWQSAFPLVAFLQLFFLNCCGDIFTLHSQCAL